MDYDYSNTVLDRKIEQLKECNREIELMIETLDTDSSSSESIGYSEHNEISIDPRFFVNQSSLNYSKRSSSLYENSYRPHSVYNGRDHDQRNDNRRVFLKEPRNVPNKAKISFSIKRPFVPRPPKVTINKNTEARQPRIVNDFNKDFQNKIQRETSEFVERCISAPLRRTGSSYDLKNSVSKQPIPRPSRSSMGPSHSRPKTGPKSMTLSSSKVKNFQNLNTWVPNGKISHPVSISLTNLNDYKKQTEENDPKNEKIKQLEQNWKPSGKLREKSATSESKISLKETISDEKLNKKKVQLKEIENKWKPGGKIKEAAYPKHSLKEPKIGQAESELDLNVKGDTRVKELESKWKPGGKIKEPFVPFKSIEIKNVSQSIDKKKQEDEKKIKVLENKWKPGTKSQLTVEVSEQPLRQSTTPVVEKPPLKPENNKIKDLEKKWKPSGKTAVNSKFPTNESKTESGPKPNVKPKVLVEKKLLSQKTVDIPEKKQDSSLSNSMESRKPVENEIGDEVPVGHSSTINGSNVKIEESVSVDPDELAKKADLEFENDIKSDLLSRLKKNGQTSTPKREKIVEKPAEEIKSIGKDEEKSLIVNESEDDLNGKVDSTNGTLKEKTNEIASEKNDEIDVESTEKDSDEEDNKQPQIWQQVDDDDN
jgi:hypothetical protein